MNDLYIKYFLEIVDQGVSFTKASQNLYVSQPALTKHIKALSDELGVKLIDTTRKNIPCLTPAGKLYYEFFTEYRNKFNKVRDEANILAKKQLGAINIAAFEGWDMLETLPIKLSFEKEYPNHSLDVAMIGFKALKNGLLNNQFDMALTLSDQFRGIPNICIHDHYHISGILLFSFNHPLANKKELDITDFYDDIFYVLAEDETPLPRQISEEYCKSKGFTPRFKALPTTGSILLALQMGHGYTIADQWFRVRNDPFFKFLQLDMFFTISDVWKEDNSKEALRLFLSTYIVNQQLPQ